MDQEKLKDSNLEESLDAEYEPAPSFKDEMRAVGNFFKKLFGRIYQASDETLEEETNTTANLEKEKTQSSIVETEYEPTTNVDTVQNSLKDSGNENKIPSINESVSIDLPTEVVSTDIVRVKKKGKWFVRKKKPQLSNEQIQEKKVKFYKGITSTFLFLLVFFAVSFFGFTSTSKKEFCQSCHEMKPEHYTLMASSHADVECVDCHSNPGLEEMFKVKIRTINMFSKKLTDRADIPITLKTEVSDKACNKCHKMDKRTVSAQGDIIIPHVKHQKNHVECVFCHGGVAHGKIAERNVIKKSDYSNWDAEIGKLMMADKSYIKTKMTTCTICHEARDVSNECTTCHSTGMYPETHKSSDFASSTHGPIARSDIQQCDYCHQYTTRKPIEVVKTVKSYQNNGGSKDDVVISTTQYVFENDFCRDCHSKRPPSHQVNKFFLNHGTLATNNKEKCYGCHSQNATSKRNQVAASRVVCGSCHPSSHKDNYYKEKHPIIKDGNVNKLQESCFRCHSRGKCAKCHDNFRIR
ncbi:MAG: NapC/NirT cytochrome c domain protein [Bacillales bacterium]|nr:NapC/NirT cytochrome c domain protein [Bacillales bacterium]